MFDVVVCPEGVAKLVWFGLIDQDEAVLRFQSKSLLCLLPPYHFRKISQDLFLVNGRPMLPPELTKFLRGFESLSYDQEHQLYAHFAYLSD